MAQALWLEVENAKFVRPNRHGPESGDITDRGLVALDAYRVERDKDAPKPAAKEPELTEQEVEDFSSHHIQHTPRPMGLTDRLVRFGLLEDNRTTPTAKGRAVLDIAMHAAKPEPEFVQLKGHMPAFPGAETKPVASTELSTQEGNAFVNWYVEGAVQLSEQLEMKLNRLGWLGMTLDGVLVVTPQGRDFLRARGVHVDVPKPHPVAKSAAELVLRIQYEECVRLARLLKSDLAWVEVGKREAELKAPRGE